MEKMKSIVFLYAGFCTESVFDKVFDSKSSFDRALEWAASVDYCSKIVVFVSETTKKQAESAAAGLEKVTLEYLESWNVSQLIKKMSALTEENQCDFAVYSFADRPFLDNGLTSEIINTHLKYIAEYTTADGYPSGFAPEVIDAGALKIMVSFAEGVKKEEGEKFVLPGSIFEIMKGDINSFDIEAVIAPKDWRLLRMEFSVSQKIKREACIALYKTAKEKNIQFTADKLSYLAEETAEVQKTLPAFYNIQIARNCAIIDDFTPYAYQFKKKYGALPLKNGKGHGQLDMSLDDFSKIISQIVAFSESAVVSLSGWGEPLTVENLADYVSIVLANPGLSVLIETDGVLLTPQIAESIANIAHIVPVRTDRGPSVSWIVKLDAATEEKYARMHINTADFDDAEKSAFTKAKEAVSILNNLFPGDVYPQFIRVNENEDELEQFYRFWHEKKSPSSGNLIIQKYDYFCGKQPDRKPADLSPLHRIPCWHLKRDMTILADGNVPLCREYVLSYSVGNVLEEGLEAVWNKFNERFLKQLNNEYEDKCGACDEYYTFNF
ncbi:spiro-SPASM protein [Treponema sp.]|uniref:spiro-SPASM protein n=1 Tax=Treponema sp. TaxID=166 RepID=UPI0025D2A026|nr:spiro-SPASM protein [Treponema sp.]MCR5219153.1 spiro-SPASM protein [Treponema sp.]